jgi:hypothetical protein
MPYDLRAAREDGVTDEASARFLADKTGFKVEEALADKEFVGNRTEEEMYTFIAEALTDQVNATPKAPTIPIPTTEEEFQELTPEQRKQAIESETLEANPWVDPVSAFTAGFGSTTYLGKGAPFIARGIKGVTAGALNAFMDLPVGVVADEVGKVDSKYSLPMSVGLGFLSGKIVETPLENKVMKGLGRLGIKGVKKLTDLSKGIRSDLINDDYNKTVRSWISVEDWQEQISDVQMSGLRQAIRDSIGEKQQNVMRKIFTGKIQDIKQSELIDQAIQVYIDTKNNPDHIAKYFNQLTDQQKEIVRLSQNLTPQQIEIANQIEAQYAKFLDYANANDININSVDNYVNRAWKLKNKNVFNNELFRKFGTTTKHSKRRTLDTILQGWAMKDANGDPLLELMSPGATRSLSIYEQEITKAANNKRFIGDLLEMTALDGSPMLSKNDLPGYVPIEHPNFKAWDYAGTIEQFDAKTIQGKDFFINTDGTVLRRRDLYAHPSIAKNLNNIMGISKLKGHAFWDAATKGAALTKAWKLFTSFFHDVAFMGSYFLGGKPGVGFIQDIKAGKGIGVAANENLNPAGVYRSGLRAHKKAAENYMEVLETMTPKEAQDAGRTAINMLEPEVELLIKNGMTVGRIQDWEEAILRNEDTMIRNFIHKNKLTGYVGDSIIALREAHTDFMFQHFGKGLKIKAALIELKSLIKKHPELDPNEAAAMVARLMNDDFGGLHLKLMGRNPTTQHMARVLMLAPDWTESNLRTVTGTFKNGLEGELYRRFWNRVITKTILGSMILNALLTGGDEEELSKVYGKAISNGKLRVLDVDLTSIYRALGGREPVRKYFRLAGHFKDPYLWTRRPIGTTLYYKSSIIGQILHDFLTGEDWQGRQFTRINELMRTGKTVRPRYTFGVPQPGIASIPSFVLNKVEDAGLPIPAYNMLQWWKGEMDGFSAISKSIGLKVDQEPFASPRQKAREKVLRKRIRAMYPRKR